ncbi:MAG: HEAT repeat domain-containing protein [Pirellulales bacterium]|nr:HEAT repeat domain-containing protein [Pirellulales bacterium]
MVPPHERMAHLKELAKNAAGAGVKRQGIAQQLAEEFRAEDDPLLRAQLVRTLAAYPCRESADALRAALEDPVSDVRIAACKAWGERAKQGDPEAATLLGQRIASDADTEVRLAATRALGQTRDPAALAGLGIALDDQDPALQRRAVLALRETSGNTELGYDVGKWRQYVQARAPRAEGTAELARRPEGAL